VGNFTPMMLSMLYVAVCTTLIALMLWLLLWPRSSRKVAVNAEPEAAVSEDVVEEAEGMKKFWLVWPLGVEEGAKNVHEHEQYACEEAERRAALLSEPVAVLEAVRAYGRPVQELDLED
jgi:hypothetical protein